MAVKMSLVVFQAVTPYGLGSIDSSASGDAAHLSMNQNVCRKGI
jgi:hypothetical protein